MLTTTLDSAIEYMTSKRYSITAVSLNSTENQIAHVRHVQLESRWFYPGVHLGFSFVSQYGKVLKWPSPLMYLSLEKTWNAIMTFILRKYDTLHSPNFSLSIYSSWFLTMLHSFVLSVSANFNKKLAVHWFLNIRHTSIWKYLVTIGARQFYRSLSSFEVFITVCCAILYKSAFYTRFWTWDYCYIGRGYHNKICMRWNCCQFISDRRERVRRAFFYFTNHAVNI